MKNEMKVLLVLIILILVIDVVFFVSRTKTVETVRLEGQHKRFLDRGDVLIVPEKHPHLSLLKHDDSDSATMTVLVNLTGFEDKESRR